MTKAEIAKIVEQEKIIAIVRGVEPQKCIDVAKALYDGGIRMMEITFNAKCLAFCGKSELPSPHAYQIKTYLHKTTEI